MTSTTRVPPTEITGILGAMAKRFSKKKLGDVPESLGVMWHNQRVLRTFMGFSGKAEKWDACATQLKSFAHMAAVAQVGCSACLDFGYFQARDKKLDMDKAREVPRWRESGAFTPLERDVLEYAEAMTQTPPGHGSRETAGVERLPPYDLRHAFASLQIRAGTSIPELAEQLGHAPQMTLSTYAHVMRELKGLPPLSADAQIQAAREARRPLVDLVPLSGS